MLDIVEASMDSHDGRRLIAELEQQLLQITGDSGSTTFHPEDLKEEKSVFLIAYLDGVPCGCGALRKISEDTAEIKRVYARKNGAGVGRAIVGQLEKRAREFGYHRLLLETRRQNIHAIAFYEKCGFTHCSPYGIYQGKENAYCFEKKLTVSFSVI